jgi:DNA-binding MarR family transcriptional regulator
MNKRSNRSHAVSFGALSEHLGYVLRRAQMAVFADVIEALKGVDLTPGKFSVLFLIRENPGLPQSAICEALGILKGNFVALLHEFERRGLAERRAGGPDARTNALYLTRRGRDLLRRAIASKQLSPGPFVNAHLLPPGEQCAPGQTVGCFDYTPYLQTGSSGVNLFSPEWTFNAGLEYTANLADRISLTPRVNYSYTSSQFTSLTYSEVTDFLPAHGLLSALVTLKLRDRWAVGAYGTNLSNRLYRTGQGLDNGNYYFYGPPRQYGARVQYHF